MTKEELGFTGFDGSVFLTKKMYKNRKKRYTNPSDEV